MSILVGGMCSICCHMALVLAFICIYIVFINCDCFCPFFYFIIFKKNLISKRQTEAVNGSSIFELYLPFFFTRAIPKGLTSGLCLYYVSRL